MGLFTFKGGIHPYDGKDLSKNQKIVEIRPTGDLVFPLSQHIGAPATAIVAKGDLILRGQMIAEATGFVSANIYSSVSGKVKAIEPRFTASGSKVNSIIIQNDNEYTEVEMKPLKKLEELTKEEIIGEIKKAGIVGMGGAGFPTHVKLSPKEPDKIDYVIANCAECEPYITADYRRMLENPEDLVNGMRIALRLFDNATGIFGVEDNKLDCVEKLQEIIKDEPRMKVIAVKTKYPQGGERQLIFATTKRRLNSKLLPADVGCVVQNAEGLIAISEAVSKGRPLMERVLTISGDAITNPSNFKVCLGTNHAELIEAAGGFKEEPKKIISGGPMMGFSIFTPEAPVAKTTSSLLCMTRDEVAEYEPTQCINCGKCVSVCPSRIIPSRLADYSEHQDAVMFEKWNGMECIECGCCSYVCPAKRPLKQSMGSMRKIVMANRRK